MDTASHHSCLIGCGVSNLYWCAQFDRQAALGPITNPSHLVHSFVIHPFCVLRSCFDRLPGLSARRNPLILVLMAGAAVAIWYVWLPLPVVLVPAFFQAPVAVRGASPLVVAAPEAQSRRLSDQYAQYATLATTPRSSILVAAPRGASPWSLKLSTENPLQQRLFEPDVDFK